MAKQEVLNFKKYGEDFKLFIENGELYLVISDGDAIS